MHNSLLGSSCRRWLFYLVKSCSWLPKVNDPECGWVKGKLHIFIYLLQILPEGVRQHSFHSLLSLGWAVSLHIMLHSHTLGLPPLSSCLSFFLWYSKCQKISFWNKSDTESSIPTSPGELSHRSVSWHGPVQSTEGSAIIKECGFESLSLREGETGRERRKSRVKGHVELLLDNTTCFVTVKLQSYTW